MNKLSSVLNEVDAQLKRVHMDISVFPPGNAVLEDHIRETLDKLESTRERLSPFIGREFAAVTVAGVLDADENDPNASMFRNFYPCSEEDADLTCHFGGMERFLQYGVRYGDEPQDLWIGASGLPGKVVPSSSCSECTKVLRRSLAARDDRLLMTGSAPPRVKGHKPSSCPLNNLPDGEGLLQVEQACELYAANVHYHYIKGCSE
jgi:hypothetical protein